MTTMTEQAKEAQTKWAEVIDEVARRLRLPNPDAKDIEMAANDLEQYAREMREDHFNRNVCVAAPPSGASPK